MNRHRFLLLGPVALVALAAAATVACSGGASGSGSDDSGPYAACIQSEMAKRSTTQTAAQTPQGPFEASLLQTDPASVASVIRDNLKSDARRQIESGRSTRIATARCEHLRPPPSQGSSGGADAGVATGMPSNGSSSGGFGAAPPDSAESASEVSTTNNQVAGVDEADFIKNDNKYIYVANGSHFRVIDAYPPTNAHEIASLVVPGEAKKLFVEGNRAVVYSAVLPQGQSNGRHDGRSGGAAYRPGGNGECTYGYDGCIPSGDGTETEISIFDVTDRAAPKLVRSIHSTSSLIAARRIGNAVHTVLGQQPLGNDSFYHDTYMHDLPATATEEQINKAYDDLLTKAISNIDAREINVLPKWTDSAGRTPDLSLYQSSMPDGAALTSVLSIDLLSDPTLKVESVISRPGWVYASSTGLYMAVPHQPISGWGWFEGQTETELTTVHKFTIGTTPFATGYVGSGIVKGHVINQLAMDEKDGRLRVATSVGHVPSPDVYSAVSVMEDKSGELQIVGQVDRIAPNEDIRSVRFDGDRGYIVTFKKTDPLFVFDLVDPLAPKMLGELKIPGFSTYMHMMDATHLLTIGYDADDKGDFAFFTGVLLQIFDVTDPTNPTLAHKESIGTRGSSSEALTNHLAFNYFAPKDLLALPMTICEGGNTNGGFGTTMTFSGLMVYDTTAASGFSLRGKVAHPNSASGSQNDHGYYDMGCSNWWTNASSEVRRSIIMDDYVFSVSSTRIKVNNLDALSTDVKELSIQ